jgi:2,3-bisphosphoglycerate-independent phosphoglycerate mutase
MRYIIILIDGMADYRIAELGDRTPLQYAKTPVLDSLAKNSEMGTIKTIPEGMTPGSDTANLSVLGYDPKKYYTGRSSLEAVSLGINLLENDVVFRCNLVTLSGEDNYTDRIMIDYSAGEIPTSQARVLIEYIGSKLQTGNIRFYPGLSYRNIIVWKMA